MTTCNLQPPTCPRCGKATEMPFHTCVKAAGLTPRQAEVMREICKGKIGKEIGRDMGVSTRTVETHIQLAKRALGARNIVQAAVLFSKLETFNLSPAPCHQSPTLTKAIATDNRAANGA